MRVLSPREIELRSVVTLAGRQMVRECLVEYDKNLIFLIFLKNINIWKYTSVREQAWQRKTITAGATHRMTTLNVYRVPGSK
jgi:hypothetical protein